MVKFEMGKHVPDFWNFACEKAEPAFYAYLMKEKNPRIVTPRLEGSRVRGVQKVGIGLETVLCLGGECAGWIMVPEEQQDVVRLGRPLYEEPSEWVVRRVAKGSLLGNPPEFTMMEQMKIIFSRFNYLDKLLALMKQRSLEVDESVFRANVGAYTAWLNELIAQKRYKRDGHKSRYTE